MTCRSFGLAIIGTVAIGLFGDKAPKAAQPPVEVVRQRLEVTEGDAHFDGAEASLTSGSLTLPGGTLGVGAEGSLFAGPTTASLVHLSSAIESGKQVVIVFYWPNQARKAGYAVEKLEQYDHLAVVPMCLINEFAGEELVAQYWQQYDLGAFKYNDMQLTPITSATDLED